jgi:hypothetical protein
MIRRLHAVQLGERRALHASVVHDQAGVAIRLLIFTSYRGDDLRERQHRGLALAPAALPMLRQLLGEIENAL